MSLALRKWRDHKTGDMIHMVDLHLISDDTVFSVHFAVREGDVAELDQQVVAVQTAWWDEEASSPCRATVARVRAEYEDEEFISELNQFLRCGSDFSGDLVMMVEESEPDDTS